MKTIKTIALGMRLAIIITIAILFVIHPTYAKAVTTTTIDFSAYSNAFPPMPVLYFPGILSPFDDSIYAPNTVSANSITSQYYTDKGILLTNDVLNGVYGIFSSNYYPDHPAFSFGTDAEVIFDPNYFGNVISATVQVYVNGGETVTVFAGPQTHSITSSQAVTFNSSTAPLNSIGIYSSYSAITGISVQSVPSATLDLAAGTPSPGSPAKKGSEGRYQISPDTTFIVEVPVSGNNFNSPETRSTTVTLSAGSEPIQSQTISLSAIQTAGGTINVPFTVMFTSADVGIQTITATVDPGNLLDESNFANNTASVQVDVIQKAVLTVTLPDTPPAQQSMSGSTITAITPPSVLEHARCGNSGLSTVTRQVVIDCIDPTILPPLSAHIDGCTYRLALSVTKDGGHHADYHTGKRPQMVADPDDGETDPQDIPPGGATITMTVPEVAGETTVVVSGYGPGQNGPLTPISAVFDVMVPNMFPLNQAELYFTDIYHHPDDGFYGNYGFLVSLQIMLSSYSTQVLNDTGTPGRPIQSQAASLSWGGLFDYPGKWTTPHCAHRDGSAVDLEFGLLSATEQQDLADTVYDSDNLTFYAAESPNPPTSVTSPPTHWHVMLIGSQQN